MAPKRVSLQMQELRLVFSDELLTSSVRGYGCTIGLSLSIRSTIVWREQDAFMLAPVFSVSHSLTEVICFIRQVVKLWGGLSTATVRSLG